MSQSIQELFQSIRRGAGSWLLLLDIDGTLIETGGQGMAALNRTARDVFGDDGPPLNLAGSTDLGVLDSIYAHFGQEPSDELTHQFFETYHFNLRESLELDPSKGEVLDGAIELLEEFQGYAHVELALLTGNTDEGAQIKLKHYLLERYFTFGAFGSDRADRNLLGPIALERAFAFTGRKYEADQILIIGDTPKDIACAHAIGAKCLAVSTGEFSAVELKYAGADWVVESLRDLAAELETYAT
ncbi:HAD family hydrolase [Luteolibacter sp. AS25]|uniref:HAD family hydrolase n=1 Tax=Luteolibacter sp. AS25 TaxID=3135776 RepID=UPI00398AFBE6